MLKKTITYKNLDNEDVTDEFYFHLSEADLAEMELAEDGGLAAKLKHIIESDDRAAIIRTFKELIAKSVGQRSDDGKRFIKSKDITDEFMQTDAFSVLFMELVTDAQAAAAWIVGVVPQKLSEKLSTREITGIEDVQLPEKPVVETRKEDRRLRDFTETELMTMTDMEFNRLIGMETGSVPKNVLIIAMKRKTNGPIQTNTPSK